jgi:hypothetical protein
LFGNENEKEPNDVDGLCYVNGNGPMSHTFVEKIGEQFYLRKFHEFRQFIPTSSQEESKDSYDIWMANLLKNIYYTVDGNEIDKDKENITKVLQGLKIEDLSKLPENFKTHPSGSEYIRFYKNDKGDTIYKMHTANPEAKFKEAMIGINLEHLQNPHA